MRFKWINLKKCLIVFWWCIYVNSVIFSNLTKSSNISRKYHELHMDQLKEMFKSIWIVYSCEPRWWTEMLRRRRRPAGVSVTTSNSSSVEHSPNNCIISESKMLERKRYVRSVRPKEECQDSEVELRRRKNENKNTTAEKLRRNHSESRWLEEEDGALAG